MSELARRPLNETFRALGNRNYRLFWWGQLVSLCGTWMQKVAQAWLVLQLTDSPQALGVVTALQFLPVLFLALIGGVLADRLPKRRVLIGTQSAMCVLAAILAGLSYSGQIQIWHVFVLAALLGLANAFDNPARQAFVIEMVGPRDIPNAVALNSILFNGSRILGPAIAGAIIAAQGVELCFAVNAVSYLGVIAGLLAMRPSEFHEAPVVRRGALLHQVGEGLAYALRTREICLIVILMFTLGTFGQNFNTFMPLLARYVLDSGPFGLGLMFACLGLGSVVAALGVASRRGVDERALFWGAGIYALFLLAVALSSSFLVTGLLLLGLGASSIVFSTTANTRLQLLAPPELRGRVMSLHSLLFAGTTPFGSYFIGTLSERAGVQPAVATCAFICMLGFGVAWAYARRGASLPQAPVWPTPPLKAALPARHAEREPGLESGR